ncbi:MAG: TRAP transporter small permease [Deltaproteobacteria bacterium]
MEGLKRFTEYLNDIFVLFGGISLILMMGIACANMVLRLGGRPMSAAYELVGFLGALTVSLPLGYTQLKKTHIAVDILSQKFPVPVRRFVVGLSLLLGMGFFFVAAWKVGSYANTLRLSGEVSETLRMAYYPFTYGVAAACALMTFTLAVDFLVLLFSPKEDGT